MLGNTPDSLGIGLLFVKAKLLEPDKIPIFSQLANAEKLSLVQYLVEKNILSSIQVAQILACEFELPLIDIDHIELESIPMLLVNEKLVRRYRMLPLSQQGSNLQVVTDDPSQQDGFKEFQFYTGLTICPGVAETDKLTKLMERLLSLKEHQHLSQALDAMASFDNATETIEATTNDAPIVKFINRILHDAIQQKASDIHFEPFEKEYRIRYRQDGFLHEIAKPPLSLSARITTRIKILSNLNISEKRLPQDGSFKMPIAPDQLIDFRVSTCPTLYGEKIVIRILNQNTINFDWEMLGFNPIQKEIFIRAIQRPQGLILVTGPTGSGKTITLYAALNRLNTSEVNISTIEDPVEIKIKGINQININPKAGLTFSTALRAFLRQDPDIIMVGEIRDLETAEIATRAAQTGHLVLSTLHTNSAVETLSRLNNLGIPTLDMISSVTLIIAQRLVRKLCDYCKLARTDCNKDALLKLGFSEADLEKKIFYKSNGCAKCFNGYQGQIGLFEMLSIDKQLTALILSGANSLEILKMAQAKGMKTILQSGIEKVKEGITTFEELSRITID